MNSHDSRTETVPERSLYGNIIGILENRRELERVQNELLKLGASNFISLNTLDGIDQMVKWRESVAQYFMGDMETKMLERYIDAARSEQGVFAVTVSPDLANEAGALAKSLGAVQVVHFGDSVITNY